MMGRIHCEGCGGDFTAADSVTASHLCPALLAAQARLTELSAENEKRRVSEAKAWDEVAALRDMSGNWQAAENRADAAQSRLTRIEEAARGEPIRDDYPQRVRVLLKLAQSLDTPSTPEETQP